MNWLRRGKVETKPQKYPNGRGFQLMTQEKRREIASMGGKASHGGGRPRKMVV